MSQSPSQIKPPGKPTKIRQRPTRTEIASAASAGTSEQTEHDDERRFTNPPPGERYRRQLNQRHRRHDHHPADERKPTAEAPSIFQVGPAK
jgi:hypothetical protein